MTALHYQSIVKLAPMIKARKLSPVELTESMLERIDAIDPQLNAFAFVTAELAMDQARQAEKEISAGRYRGTLHGIPIAVKDLFDTASVPTACGSTILAGRVPETNAVVVQKLAQSGSILLGKLNMTEFALSGYHPDLPVPVNPWAADRWSGVSSSGSGVATAAGLAFATLGSDTGGSIRFPSAANGVVGIKPTFGTVSTRGAFPLAQTLDHIGPMTRTVRDAAIVLQAIAGFDPQDPFSRESRKGEYTKNINNGIEGMIIGIDEAYCQQNAHPKVSRGVLDAVKVFTDAGARVEEVDLSGVLETCEYWGAVVAADAMMAHSQWFPEQSENYGPVFRSVLKASKQISGTMYANSRVAAARTKAIISSALGSVDAILCPSSPLPAMPLEEFPPQAVLPPATVSEFVAFTAPTNFSGHPTISVPCGFASDNLPLSLQLIGAYGEEKTIIQLANAYEQATPWHSMRPPLD
ncbi:MAG: amidase [Gammaproteobacteria bacterium]|nr:amidase [Gammaproteobacteria bacterium]